MQVRNTPPPIVQWYLRYSSHGTRFQLHAPRCLALRHHFRPLWRPSSISMPYVLYFLFHFTYRHLFWLEATRHKRYANLSQSVMLVLYWVV